jgi:hypothetical protein
MRQKIINYYVEAENQDDALEQFAPRVREILRKYRAKRQLSKIANRLGFHGARLTEMITKDGNGDYKRRITPYYLAKFIDGGVINVHQILNGRKLEDLPDRARIFFERMSLSRETIRLVVEAKTRGIDVDRLLETILYPEIVHKDQ